MIPLHATDRCRHFVFFIATLLLLLCLCKESIPLKTFNLKVFKWLEKQLLTILNRAS